ncbi:class I SAM-dependent methyltransferase [Aliifodinibius sp. S!AR15-10]|uniref:class I SAM-dependent methyltransferase n=1 Tax=Aliifodinibius sp. S!AR15-10 TaxID=2950437 RepID=UPI002859819D|nr:class I SAM-dependent methyltransferase [Aliifodinibius sp. S!AR15-10]MDR8390233.1 class I SAM-dependent methyltransferase [Aliifodinibius sp. S!AR15-10]
MQPSTIEQKNKERGHHLSNTAHCRFCNEELSDVFVDLGMSPLSNSYLKASELDQAEQFYPLTAMVCPSCFLVQLREYESPSDIFSDYAYFSSYSDSWLEHARQYVEMVTERFKISKDSLVVELASNDGYLLKNFLANGVPILGIEPAENVAQAAIEKGIPTLVEFFGRELAEKLASENKRADLIIGNNVLAHVPDINSFVGGIKTLLKPEGVATLEFPHLLNLIEENQFDTIYHEHFSYISFLAVSAIFDSHGMNIFDVDEIPTHGGSLRIYASHKKSSHKEQDSTSALIDKELAAGLDQMSTYYTFSEGVQQVKRDLLEKLIEIKNEGKTIAGYGAAAKGNTLLNYCGIRTDMVDYVVDRNPNKAGKFLPGTHIPVKDVSTIKEDKPDYLFILPWNLKKEIIAQNSFIREWGGKFIIPIPQVQIID